MQIEYMSPASCQRRRARLDRQHRPQHAGSHRRSGGSLQRVALSAHASFDLLDRAGPTSFSRAGSWPADAAAAAADAIGRPARGRRTARRAARALERTASRPDVDIVVAAIVGSAGLRGTWAAVEAGKTVALANKETMVVAGPLVTRLAAERGARIVPVDSEHSAVFQALQAGRRDEVKRVILTASGGPFRNHSPSNWPR